MDFDCSLLCGPRLRSKSMSSCKRPNYKRPVSIEKGLREQVLRMDFLGHRPRTYTQPALNTLYEGHRRRAYSSPASDLAARRGVFSRRHYGSVELLCSCDNDGVENAGRFRVETGDREVEDFSSPLNSPVHLENPESQTRWYFRYFLGKMHQNYVGTIDSSSKDPFFLSVVVTDANNHNVPQYRAILWRTTGTQKICLPYNPNKPNTVKAILSHFDLHKLDKGPKEIFNPEIQKELLVLEEQEGSVNFKFGVVYCKDGQSSDDDMYNNEIGSPEFQRFLNLLGDRVPLKGWEQFRGGLDVKTNSTGEESIYTVYEGHEVMFHVSTMLPFSDSNKQQVERKRHIGNDIVNIIYVDECDSNKMPSFRPSSMKTQFTHIFAVVTFDKDNGVYKLIVYSEETVPLFGPPLPSPPVFEDFDEFRDFLLVKLLNGEKAAFNTPVFAQKRHRTLEMLIRNLHEEYLPESSKNNMLNRRAFSDVIPDVHSSRRKEEARCAEFLRIGQALKLKIILKGDAPTSMITTGLLRREPWEPQCFHHGFPYSIICGDSWGDKLIVATEAGTFVIEEDLPPRLIFDKTIPIKQLTVAEPYGLLIIRSEKGREGRINVFRLTEFEGEQNDNLVRTKADCKDHKMERSKGCHLYAVSRPGGSHLRLIIAVGKKLSLYTWKHSAAWAAWCHSTDTDTVDGFQFIRELQAFEQPQLITLIDGSHGDNQICVGYKNQYDLVNEKNGDTLQLYNIEANRVNMVSSIDIYEDDEAELLLTYNHISHFQKLTEESSQELDFHWNSEPQAMVCAFPYIMAFTPDTIEIRLIINGNLVHTMTMPDLGLITSKCDVYFISSAHDMYIHSPTERCKDAYSFSPPPSPSVHAASPFNIYKIPLLCLAGQITNDKPLHDSPTTPQPQSMLSPLVMSQSPGYGTKSPLSKGIKVAPSLNNTSTEKHRTDSSSSSADSGIHLKTGESPPHSPRIHFALSLEDDNVEETDIL